MDYDKGLPCVVSIVTALLDVKLVAGVHRLIDGFWLRGEYSDCTLRQS